MASLQATQSAWGLRCPVSSVFPSLALFAFPRCERVGVGGRDREGGGGRSPLSSPTLCGLCESLRILSLGDSQTGSQGVNNHTPGRAGTVGNGVKVAQEMRLRNLFLGGTHHLATWLGLD